MLQGNSRGERLARGFKTPCFFTEIIKGAGKSRLLSFRSWSYTARHRFYRGRILRLGHSEATLCELGVELFSNSFAETLAYLDY